MPMATKMPTVPEPALYYFDTIVLSNFALSGRLAPQEADDLLQNMIDAGYFSPVDQISGLL